MAISEADCGVLLDVDAGDGDGAKAGAAVNPLSDVAVRFLAVLDLRRVPVAAVAAGTVPALL